MQPTVRIDLFTTELKTPDNKKVIVPNSAIFGSKITNFNGYALRRVDVDVGTDYRADVRKTRGVLEALLPTIDDVLVDPAPQVFLKALGASSVDWQLRVWCKSEAYGDVWQRLTQQTKTALDGADIGIPFPQLSVHIEQATRTDEA